MRKRGGAFWKIVERRRARTGQSVIAAAERAGVPQGSVRPALRTRTAACAGRSDMPRHRAGCPVSAGVSDAGRRHRRCRLRPHPPLGGGSRLQPQRRRATRVRWPSWRSGATGCAVAGCGRDNPSGTRRARRCDGTGLLWWRRGLDGAGFSGAQAQPRGGLLDRGRLGHRAAGRLGAGWLLSSDNPGDCPPTMLAARARIVGWRGTWAERPMTRTRLARAVGSAFKGLRGMAGRRLWSGWPGRCRGCGDQEGPSFGAAGRRLVAGRSATAGQWPARRPRRSVWIAGRCRRLVGDGALPCALWPALIAVSGWNGRRPPPAAPLCGLRARDRAGGS